MALIKCVECGKDISDKANNCVHCGSPNFKKQFMENKFFSRLDYVNACKLLLELKGIHDYDEPNGIDKDSPRYATSWSRKHCNRLSEDIDLETIRLVSDNAESYYEKIHGYINHEIELKIAIMGTGDNSENRKASSKKEVSEKEEKTTITPTKEQPDYQRRIEERNRVVEILTQPVKNTDANYVESATCPNCHKNSVYRISNVKRGASIGFFGMFSKDIGKTMECRSCGYKW